MIQYILWALYINLILKIIKRVGINFNPSLRLDINGLSRKTPVSHQRNLSKQIHTHRRISGATEENQGLPKNSQRYFNKAYQDFRKQETEIAGKNGSIETRKQRNNSKSKYL